MSIDQMTWFFLIVLCLSIASGIYLRKRQIDREHARLRHQMNCYEKALKNDRADHITESEVKQLKAYLEMKAQSLEEAAKTFTSNYDMALSIAKANGFREALQAIESGSYKWYKRTDTKAYWTHPDGSPVFWKELGGEAVPLSAADRREEG